jgi:transglutaminase-like putative cysteine protease
METFLARVREANRTPVVEDSVALPVAVFVAVMIATFGALQLGIGGAPIQVACVVGIPGGYVLSHRLRHRNRGWLKLLLGIGAVLAFAQFLGLLGPAFAGQVLGLQAGLIELLLWVQVLHSLDLPGRRDVLFSLGTSGALLIVTASLATTNGFGLTVLLWFAAALVALVIANLDDAGVRVRRARHARSVPTTLLATAAVGIFVFAILPPARVFSFGLPSRAATGGISTGGRLVNPAFNALPSVAGRGGQTGTFGYFGFMDNVDLGFRGRPDDTLVMRVRAPGPDFWRAQTFDTYDGQRWSNSDTDTHRIFGRNGLIPVTPPEDRPMLAGDDFIQTFYIAKIAPNVVFAAATPSQVYWPFDEAYQLSDGTLRGGDTLAPGTVYSVISRRLRVTADMLRVADPRRRYHESDTYTRYTELPSSIPERVQTLAADLARNAPTTYDAIQAMTDWIATHTAYSLNPPRLHRGEDAVEQFLFEDRRGFCEQIASSLVVMLRSVGIPARLTVGYAPGHRNPFSGLYEVRASDAHAYTEVLFPGVGWQAFDPTADVPLAGDSGAFPRFAGAGLTKWVGERLPSRVQFVGAAFMTFVAAAAVAVALRVRRARQETWLARQLRRLEQRAGVTIDDAATLPRWLAQLPSEQRQELEPVVRALEHEAWAAQPLHDEDRRWVEKKLEKVR